MTDYIERQAAIDAVLELDTTHRVSWRDAVVDMIDAMPSADVQPVVHWIPCSDCERKCEKWEHSKTLQE